MYDLLNLTVMVYNLLEGEKSVMFIPEIIISVTVGFLFYMFTMCSC